MFDSGRRHSRRSLSPTKVPSRSSPRDVRQMSDSAAAGPGRGDRFLLRRRRNLYSVLSEALSYLRLPGQEIPTP